MRRISRRGNGDDDALPGTTHAQSLRRFKAELLDGGTFPGMAEPKLEISHHIAYHHAEKRHSALGYQSLYLFEAHFQNTSQPCAA